MNRRSAVINGIIAIVIVGAGVYASKYILRSAPKPEKKRVEKQIPVVETTMLTQQSMRPTWKAGGNVRAAKQVDIAAQIGGRIQWMNQQAMPGSRFKAGAKLAEIDKVDYQLAVKQQEATLAQSEANLQLEQGQGELASEEYKLSGFAEKNLSKEEVALILRKPQLNSAMANVQAARVALEQAQTNLQRTSVTMPFDGEITARNLNVGAQAGVNTPIFSAVATDEFWLEVKVPRHFLATLDKKQAVTLLTADGKPSTRKAMFKSILPDVDQADRQAKILLSIKQPLNDEKGPITLINDYVEAELVGKPIDNVSAIPRSKLVNEQYVWVVNGSNLYQRVVEVAYLGRDEAFIASGFEAGDELLTTLIALPVDGMEILRKAGSAE